MTQHKNSARQLMAAAAIAAAMTCGLASQAFAVPEYVKTACKADYKKFCPDYKVDTSELRACMVAIAHQLSSRCVDALERSGETHRKRK